MKKTRKAIFVMIIISLAAACLYLISFPFINVCFITVPFEINIIVQDDKGTFVNEVNVFFADVNISPNNEIESLSWLGETNSNGRLITIFKFNYCAEYSILDILNKSNPVLSGNFKIILEKEGFLKKEIHKNMLFLKRRDGKYIVITNAFLAFNKK